MTRNASPFDQPASPFTGASAQQTLFNTSPCPPQPPGSAPFGHTPPGSNPFRPPTPTSSDSLMDEG